MTKENDKNHIKDSLDIEKLIFESKKSESTPLQGIDIKQYKTREEIDFNKEERKENLKNLIQEREHKEKYASYAFWFLITWSILYWIYVFAQGYLVYTNIWFLKPPVGVIRYLTYATIANMAIFTYIIKSLFPTNKTHL